MAINSDAVEELAVLNKLKINRQPLVERMDLTFSKFRGDKFSIPATEGKWENITSNRAQSEGWKMMNLLGGSRRSIYNEITNEDSKDREKLNFNELLVNGLLFSAERMRDGLPMTPFLQSEVAFYRVCRGWGSYRLLVMEDDGGYPYLDLVVWDTRNVNYISGSNGLLKAYYERSVPKAQAQDEYPKFDFVADDKGMVRLVDVWDCIVHRDKGQPLTKKITKEAVIAGGEYVKEPVAVKIGDQTIDWLPIRIKAGGPIPLVSEIDNEGGGDSEDNIAKVGEDYLVNNRDMLDEESRAMTYKKTRAGLDAKMPTVIEYEGDLPPEFKKDPYIKGGFIFLDVSKKQKVGDPLPMTPGNLIAQYHIDIDGKLNIGGLNPIAAGEGIRGETAFGVDIRNHNTREHLDPFRKAMEEDFVWMATEIVKQFKLGSFKTDKELGGYDSKGKWKSAKIDPDKIDENKIFKCKLISDELRDKASNASLAIQLVEAGLLPKREALDDFQISDDPDGSIDTMAQETADLMFNTPVIKGYLEQLKDYAKHPDFDKKILLENAFQKVMLSQMQNAQEIAAAQGGGQPTGGAGNPATVSNRVTARKAQPTVPGGVR